MLSSLARRVGRAIHSGALWGDGDAVAVALSGGADSVALVALLEELAPRARWRLAGLLHVQHGLRGAEADADAAFCRALAAQRGLPFEQIDVDVKSEQVRSGSSLESAARRLRYAALEEAARRMGATVVATGHTVDDQAETVLLRLFRGAALRGAGAIRPRRGMFVRPLLDCRRAELREYLRARGLEWREDSSNVDRAIPRNRLRLDVLPAIEAGWPGAVPALARFARTAADDEAWLTRQAAEAAADVIRTAADGVELISEGLRRLPVPLARRVVREAIERAGGTANAADLDRVLRLAVSGRDGQQLDLRGLGVVRRGDAVRLEPARGTDAGPVPVWQYELPVPGEVHIRETGVTVRASYQTGPERPGPSHDAGAVAAVQASAVALPLTVRSRRPGDRFTPLGAPGRRRLQDVFVDRKIPRGVRDRIPIVVDAEGRIVWVASVAVAERCRVRWPEAGMVILEIKKGTS